MTRDPIVAQVRKVREAYAETFHYDIRAICDDLRKWQKETGHQYELPPKRKKGAGAVA